MIRQYKPKSTKLLKAKYEKMKNLYFDAHYKFITGRELKKVKRGDITYYHYLELANDKKATQYLATDTYRLYSKYNKTKPPFIRHKKELYITERIAFDVMRFGERTGTVRKALEKLPIVKKMIIKHSSFDYTKYENKPD